MKFVLMFLFLFLSPEDRKPAKSLTKVELKKDARKTLTSIRQTLRHNRYRKDLKMVSILIRCLSMFVSKMLLMQRERLSLFLRLPFAEPAPSFAVKSPW